MTSYRAVRFGVALLFSTAAGCAKPVGLVVLLPPPETGEVGAATVTAGGASVELTRGGEGTWVREGEEPTAPDPIPPAEVQRIFGAALEARAPAPVSFLLYFETGGEQMTEESARLVPEILAEIRRRANPDVTVIGHTDRTGDAASNATLGLRRAVLVRDLLVFNGMNAAMVTVASHGEADPLVATEDEVAEARNRRVEVAIR